MSLQAKRFTKIDEAFLCGNCGVQVPPSIDGSCRNHCNECLFSRHLDINPGDRLADCEGLMEPVDVEKKHGKYRILHKCMKCGFKRWNQVSSDDELLSYYEKKV